MRIKKKIIIYQIIPLLKEKEFGNMTTIKREKRKKRINIRKFYYRGNSDESG